MNFSFTLDEIIIYALIAAVILLVAMVANQRARLNRLFIGKHGDDLEQAIVNLIENQYTADGNIDKLNEHLKNVERRLQRSIQNAQTIRFNPFPDQGGNQSFVTCLLNEHGDGVVISSLYSREKVNIYAKPVKHFVSDHELSQEEAQSIEKVKASL